MAATSGLTASTSSATSSDLAARQSLLYPTSTLGSMNMDDLLHNIYADSPGDIAQETKPEVRFPEMTLEDYLARAGVGEEAKKVEGTGSVVGFGGKGGGGGRGRRRVGFDQADKIAQQRQRRMIKNRESAARSRERKQAYTVELESQVAKLEEQNARLKQEQEQQRKKRLKQLLESRVPVVEKRRTPRPLRRTNSLQW